MRLFEEIAGKIDPYGDLAFGGIRYVIVSGRSGYFENVKAIGALSSESAELFFRGGTLRVEGERIAVMKYGGGDLVLSGNILKVEKIG